MTDSVNGSDRTTGPFDNDEFSTLLEPEEKEGLLLSWVTFRHELNEVEQANITEGLSWAMNQVKRHDLLSDIFVRELHKRMFGDVWNWAGKFRSTERNVGIEPRRISTEVHTLLKDAKVWIECESYEKDEIAVRFHHRLVFIHPFPNGNGRHSRLMADLLAIQLRRPLFTWGGNDMTKSTETRSRYIDSLQQADRGDIAPLLKFARS